MFILLICLLRFPSNFRDCVIRTVFLFSRSTLNFCYCFRLSLLCRIEVFILMVIFTVRGDHRTSWAFCNSFFRATRRKSINQGDTVTNGSANFTNNSRSWFSMFFRYRYRKTIFSTRCIYPRSFFPNYLHIRNGDRSACVRLQSIRVLCFRVRVA